MHKSFNSFIKSVNWGFSATLVVKLRFDLLSEWSKRNDRSNLINLQRLVTGCRTPGQRILRRLLIKLFKLKSKFQSTLVQLGFGTLMTLLPSIKGRQPISYIRYYHVQMMQASRSPLEIRQSRMFKLNSIILIHCQPSRYLAGNFQLRQAMDTTGILNNRV